MKWLLLLTIFLLTACSQLPTPECDPAESAGSVLGCREAVRAALAALPAGHATVTRIQFLYGSLGPGAPLLQGEQPTHGYVVFTWADGTRRQYVALTAFRGSLSVGALAAY